MADFFILGTMVALLNLQMVKTVVFNKNNRRWRNSPVLDYSIIAMINTRVRARQTANKRVTKEE
jgi:hypothetical protein